MKVGTRIMALGTHVAFWAGSLGSLGCEQKPLGPPDPEVALAGISNPRAIAVAIHTDRGVVECQLDASRAPRAVSLFVGLATGRARWRDPQGEQIHETPLYRNLTFHRSIPGVMVQSGCPVGDASGHPGYRLPVEAHPSDEARLKQRGALVLAHYTPPPGRVDPNPPPEGHVLGSQFAITLTDMSHLAGTVSVLGTCEDLQRVAEIALAVRRDKARPRLERVNVAGIEAD